MNQTALEGMKVDGTSMASNNIFTGNIMTARSDQQGFYLRIIITMITRALI